MDALNLPSASKMCWSGVIAGAIAGVSIELLLNFLGIGIGLISINMSLDSLFNAGMGALAWLIISGCLAMAVAGWVMANSSKIACAKNRVIHGFLVWSMATLLSVAATTFTAGAMLGGASSIFKNSFRTTTEQSLLPNSQNAIASNATTDNIKNSDESSSDGSPGDKATDQLGKAAMVIFMAFFLSAISCMATTYYTKPKPE